MRKKKSFKDESLRHSQSYSTLIDTYIDIVGKNADLKRKLKEKFFNITMGILVVLALIFCTLIGVVCYGIVKKKITSQFTANMITALVSAAVSLVVSLIKIPQIIAEYLFDKKEDRVMNNLIRDIQISDKEMIEFEYKMYILLKNERVENDVSSPQSEQNIVLNEIPSGDNPDIINDTNDENEQSLENSSNIANN